MMNGFIKCLRGSAIIALLIFIPGNYLWGGPPPCPEHGMGPAPPMAPPPMAPPPAAPKPPPPPPRIYQPPPAPPKDVGVPDYNYPYDESPEEEAARLKKEKADREYRKMVNRVTGHKIRHNQPIQKDTGMKISGQKMPNTITFAGRSTVVVDQYGYPIRGKLAKDSYLWVRLRDIAGRLKSRFVKFAGGKDVTVGTAKDGEDFIVKGTLAGDELLPIPGGDSAWFKKGTEASFDEGTGTAITGTLARDTELKVEGHWKKQKFPEGTRVTINPQTGAVVASLPPSASGGD